MKAHSSRSKRNPALSKMRPGRSSSDSTVGEYAEPLSGFHADEMGAKAVKFWHFNGEILAG